MSTPLWYHRPLMGGERGRDVDIVQRKLGAPATGVYDDETRQLVRGLQEVNHLMPTGWVDEHVAAILGEAADHKLTPEWFTRTLRPGDRGQDVAALRERLGLVPSPSFDDETRRAVLRFQSAHDMKLTGIVNEQLSLKLS